MGVNAVFVETNDTRIPILLCEYVQTGRRNLSRPKEIWKGEDPWRRLKPGIVYIPLLLVYH